MIRAPNPLRSVGAADPRGGVRTRTLPDSVSGTWLNVENALAEGLLTESEVETVAARSGML